MNLDFGRCQVYKLNISACLTERELDYYNLFCDGITRKELKKRLGVDYPTSEMLSEEFHISLEDAADLLKAQMNKKCFRKFLTDEIEKFSPNEVREIRKSAIYVADEEGNLTDRIKDNKKIVWFGNECVRRCNVDLKDIPLLDQFLLLKCGSKALTGVLNQIVERGVNLDGKHYLFYTSTTGQMKETEITLVEEEYWKENEYALMCGLTEERINSKGGINMGKYFAAKALNLSNSIKYDSGISIDEVIIVPDFKTFVSGMVNYLDVNTLDIQEKKMEIEIEHMDGAGIFIPGTFPCSCQIRGGWLKGAVFPFDFHKFIEKYRDKVSAANMIDAWGNPVTVEEFLNAKMILTDSQLKMRKYYDSMQEYRKCFKKAKLSITVNNCAHQAKSEVKVAYQPFQTIPRDNLTDETIKKLADKTVRYIEDAKKNPKAALQLMGIEIDSEDMEDKMKDVEMNVLHAAILKYPQLLNDIHVQKIMKSVLLSERRKAQGCKLVLDGFWSYICPDLYAFCQWLFLGQDVPEGLVPNGYIYNHYYNDKEIEETCCLRYPHLSDCEHGIRKVLQSKECEEWFNGTDTIVSSHDLISEVLQADWDGDHICLVHDKTSNGIAKVNYSSKDAFNPEMLKNSDIKVDRTSEKYSQLRRLLLDLKREHSAWYKKVKDDLNAKESEKQLFNIYCGAKVKEIFPDRKEAANYLVDIEYHTEENQEEKKDILWNCYGDILYDNLCKNVDSDITPKVKRNVYQKSVDREKEILESRDRIKKEQEEIVKVLITKTVYDDLMGIKVRKGCEKDRYILYILYVLIRRFQAKYGEEKEYIRIYKGLRQKSKITAATYEEAVDIICGRNKKRIENEIEKSLGKIPMCAHEAMLKWDVRAAV